MERTTSMCETIDNSNHDLLDMYRDFRSREDRLRNGLDDQYDEIQKLQKTVDKQAAIINYLEDIFQVHFRVHSYRGVLIEGDIEHVGRLNDFIQSIRKNGETGTNALN